MNRRVHKVAAALLALTLVLNAPVASAAVQDRSESPSVSARIIQTIKKVLKPFVSILQDDNDEFKPTPPKP